MSSHHLNRFVATLLATAACLLPFASNAATVKALSFAITGESGKRGDRDKIKNYMVTNGIDFAVFDFSRSPTYFINAPFPNDDGNFQEAHYAKATSDYKFVVYDSDKYELLNSPADDQSSHNIVGVFRDEFGDTFALVSLRGSYSASSVKTFLDTIATKYPAARLIVTYNARVGNENAETLNASLTADSSGPQMACLGQTVVETTSVGGAYMYQADIPQSYSVSVVDSIGTTYPGTLVSLNYPTKCKVIFNDWDGTGLQTNIVYAGESVTPPTVPGRDGYTFTGWDHPASDFESVSASFTATAQYASDAAWLQVSGDPENLGTADPAYGSITEIAANDTFTATVSDPSVEEGATERWVCTGYSHYEITDTATGAKTLVAEGNDSSFTYTHVMHDELVWHFTNEWLVAVSASQGGAVSVSESWVRNGEALQLVATPEEGFALWRWEGDTDGIADVTSASISVAVTSARSLRAVFAPQGADASVQYVATTGSDANDGYSAESPKLTIQAAVNTLAVVLGHGTVHVASGVYPITASIVVTNAIAVIGDTGNPEDVIIQNTDMGKQANVIVLRVNHPTAFVANLTAENGRRYTNAASSPYGANLAIESAGGTVSNCILRGAVWSGNYPRGSGAWLNSDSALLTHCIVTNNSASGSAYQVTEGGGNAVYGGIFVHVEKGTVDNCLIANNHDTGGTTSGGQDKQSWSSGVTIRNGGRLLNSSVVTNEARWTGGVYLYPSGVATNVVVAGCVNKCTYLNEQGEIGWSDIGFKGTLANASHCASDGGEALDETCVAGTAADFFVDFENANYAPSTMSPLVNKGTAYDGIAAFDLVGKARVQGSAPDIGAYETRPTGLAIIFR